MEKVIDPLLSAKQHAGLPSKEEDASSSVQHRRFKFLTKEILDRIGYGLSSQQFLNILFVQSGAPLFLVGMLNGLKVMVSVVVSYFLDRARISRRTNKIIMSLSGVLFGITVFLMTIALARQSVPLFVLSFILGAIIAVLYGSLYQDWFQENLEMSKRGFFLSRISYYGLGISGVSMILGAYFVDRSLRGQLIDVLGFRVQGFVVVFVISAILFMFAALIMLLIHEQKGMRREGRPTVLISKETWKMLVSNNVLMTLLVTSSIISLVQTLATAYYGIFIFTVFYDTGYGGFMNVAIIFLIAMLTSIVGPIITQFNARAYGKFPMLVFGTLLLAIGPLTYYLNANLLSISVAMFLSTIGSAICGVSFGLLTVELVREDLKQSYAALSRLLTLIPFVIFIPLGSLIAQVYGMPTLFLLLTLALVFVVVPLFMAVIFVFDHRSQKI